MRKLKSDKPALHAVSIVAFLLACSSGQSQQISEDKNNVDSAQKPIETDLARTPSGNVIQFRAAANSSVGASNGEFLGLFSRMNSIMRISNYKPGLNADGTSYPADVSCQGVTFQPRDAGIVTSAQLPTIFVSDVPGYDWNSFTSVTNADVYIVLSITCGKVTNAAGCAPVGGRPRVVTANSGMDAGVWIHEHGHTLGLHHSNSATDGPTGCPNNYRSSREGEWRRVMYCRSLPQATGFTAGECQAFGGTPTTDVAAEAQAVLEAQAIINSNTSDLSISDSLRLILSRPRDENNNISPSISDLSAEEIGTVRKIITAGQPLELLEGSVVVLGERGEISDAYLLKSFILSQGLSASPSVSTAKFAALAAIGRIGGRFKSQVVLSEIIPFTDTTQSELAVGPALSESMKLQAILGVAEGKETAQPILEGFQARNTITASGAIDIKTAVPGLNAAVVGQVQRVAPISPAWLNKAMQISNAPSK